MNDDFFEQARAYFSEKARKPDQKNKHCYYTLLEIEQDATEDDIKRSYKKLALQWHPDKNRDNTEECTAQFTILKHAYETLSNPQKRAFYDKNRETILEGFSSEESKDTGIDLDNYFEKCYSGFEDDENGFFTVYRKLFNTLASEEFPYIDEEEAMQFPLFGNSKSDYEPTVAAFYDFWTSFSTKRSFSWLDEQNAQSAFDRYELKWMNKENKKCRDAGKKERNQEIRNLVQHVRKRDPRVKLYREQLEEINRKKLERVEQERKQQILKNLSELGQQTSRNKNQNKADLNDENDQANSESYYCDVCQREFKSAKSFSKHQRSNNHKKAVEEQKGRDVINSTEEKK